MIENIQINGIHANVDDDLHKYIVKKIGHLDKYLPKSARQSAHAAVKIKESTIKTKRQHTCEVVLHLPNDTITTKETTMNIYAAVDIVEAKLQNQLKKYKEKHSSAGLRHRLRRRLFKRA